MAKGDAPLPASPSQTGIVQLGTGVKQAPGLLALAPQAGILFVALSGDDTLGDGSQGNPYRTLTKAFAVMAAAPLAAGYQVHLPRLAWAEDAPLPPDRTVVVGQGGSLAGASGPLAWTEGGSDAGVIELRDVAIQIQATGRNGGNLNLRFRNCAVSGEIVLAGTVEFDGCSAYPTLTNVNSLQILNSRAGAVNLVWATATATASNGNVSSHTIEGGSWGLLSFTSDDVSVACLLLNLQATQIRAANLAQVKLRNSYAPQLVSVDSSSLISADAIEPSTYTGIGGFRLPQVAVQGTFPVSNDGSAKQVVLAVPRQPNRILDRVTAFFPALGYQVRVDSYTETTITLTVQPPGVVAAAFPFQCLVYPRS